MTDETPLLKALRSLRENFRGSRDKYAAHEGARQVLGEMAASPEVLTAILARHLSRADALEVAHYPVVALDIELNADFGLVANCWIPLPDGNTNLSTKAIHHHGQMLLTTLTALGPGYEHWTFTTPKPIDEQHELFGMRLLERAPHPKGHTAFVDAYMAHVPFYPPDLTITFALWSSKVATSWKDHVKRVPVLHKYSSGLRRVAASMGFAGMLDLKVVELFDFFPAAGGFRGMKERAEFSRGPVEDYLFSLFHIIQRTGNERLIPLLRSKRSSHADVVNRLIADLEHGRTIAGRLSTGHYGQPHANFTAQDIQRALASIESQPFRPA